MQKKNFFILPLFVIIFFELFMLLLGGEKKSVLPAYSIDEKALNNYANEVIENCKTASHRESCYEEEIPKLMDYVSMEDAFTITKIVQEKDLSYSYCHVLGHNLSAKEVSKDPSKWKEVATRCPSGICSNGCIHGGFQERFRSEFLTTEQLEEIKPDLLDLCEPRGNWNPTGLEKGSCYHALGHLLMYMTNADLIESTNLCEEIAGKPTGSDYSQVCFDGAFMQIFQPLESEDFALIKGKVPKKEEVYSFCEKFSDQKRGSCWSESWPLFREEIMTPDGLVEFCSRTLPEEMDRCFLSLFYVLPVQLQFDIEKLHSLCAFLPQERKSQCFANIASRFIETDYRNIEKSVDFCAAGMEYDAGDECFQELLFYSTYNFHAGSEEFYHLCNSLPDVWREKCLSQQH